MPVILDDTQALRDALSALPPKGGVLFFPPGHYRTDTLFPPSYCTLKGDSAFGYQESGGTILSPIKGTQPRLIDLNGKHGTRLVGLTFHGLDLGDDVIGVFVGKGFSQEQHVVIDNCRIEHFSGSGVGMMEAHVWILRHSIIMCNKQDGLDLRNAFDGWIIDCQIVANGGHGIQVDNSTTITGCRIEHNQGAGIYFNRYYGQHVQLTGNLFCSNHGPAIEALEGNVRGLAITGNTIRNNGRTPGQPERDCQVRLEGAQGVVFTGNVVHILWQNTPSYGLRIKQLRECVISNNTFFKGAMKALIWDLGGHTETVISQNPGSLKDPKDPDS
jgi:hypothetical protein